MNDVDLVKHVTLWFALALSLQGVLLGLVWIWTQRQYKELKSAIIGTIVIATGSLPKGPSDAKKPPTH